MMHGQSLHTCLALALPKYSDHLTESIAAHFLLGSVAAYLLKAVSYASDGVSSKSLLALTTIELYASR